MVNLLEARLQATARRMRLQRTLESATLWAIPAFTSVALLHGLVGAGSLTRLPSAWPAPLLLPLMAAGAAWLRPLPLATAAHALDRSHALADLVASAWSFGQLPSAARSSFMQAVVTQAVELAPRLAPTRAVPLRAPRHVAATLLTLVGLIVVVSVPRPPAASARTAAPTPTPAHVLDADDVAALRARLPESGAHDPDASALREASAELARLLDALEAGDVDAAQALSRLQSIDAKLDAARDEAGALDEALRALSKELSRAATHELGKALATPDLDAAQAAARALAERARDPRTSERGLEALREALARKQAQRAKQAGEGTGESGAQQQQKHKRELDRLERNLDEASQQLARGDRAQAGEKLEQARQSLERMAQQRAAAQQAGQLAQRTSELRELLRRSGASARGRQGSTGPSQPGEALSLSRFRAQQRGTPPSGAGTREVQASNEPPEHGDSSGGPGGGPPQSLAQSVATPPARAGADVQVDGQATRGPTRSQVIYEAAHSGFASRPYLQVHGQYERHAEHELERAEVPSGYRYYVRRYFQLIRPRESPRSTASTQEDP